MKVKYTHTVEQDIEIEFPAYRKQSDKYYKIINEKESISAWFEIYFFSEAGIEYNSLANITGGVIIEGEPITENEFLDAYFKAFQKMQKVVNPPAQTIPV